MCRSATGKIWCTWAPLSSTAAGTAVVTATGMDTEMGKIADALAQAQDEETPLQRKAQPAKQNPQRAGPRHLCCHLCSRPLPRPGRLRSDHRRHHLIDTFMVAVSLAVAAIPEGLGRRCHHRALHRRHQHVQAKRHHPKADGCGNPGLHPDHLFRQNRYPDPEPDDCR